MIIITILIIILILFFIFFIINLNKKNRLKLIQKNNEIKEINNKNEEYSLKIKELILALDKNKLTKEDLKNYQEMLIFKDKIKNDITQLQTDLSTLQMENNQEIQNYKEKIKLKQAELEDAVKKYNLLISQIDEKTILINELASDLVEKQTLFRAALLQEADNHCLQRWSFELSGKDLRLIEVIKEIIELYPELKMELATIEWKKVWLPKIQVLSSREKLEGKSGIYKLTLKKDDRICYIGQAVDIKKRWYTHIKKMIGAEACGNEFLYNGDYRPEDFFWEIVEEKEGNLNSDEQYWIEFFGCKEIGLNRKKG